MEGGVEGREQDSEDQPELWEEVAGNNNSNKWETPLSIHLYL